MLFSTGCSAVYAGFVVWLLLEARSTFVWTVGTACLCELFVEDFASHMYIQHLC